MYVKLLKVVPAKPRFPSKGIETVLDDLKARNPNAFDGTYRFRQALVDEGLVETWTDVTPVHYTFKK